MMRNKYLGLLIVFLLSGCDAGDNKDADVNGKFFGSYPDSDITTVVYQNKFFYTMYTAQNRAIPAGFDYGTLSASKGSITDGVGWKFSATRRSSSMTLWGWYARGLLNQEIISTLGKTKITLPSAKGFDVVPLVSKIAGTMQGSFVQSSETDSPGTQTGMLTISLDGKVTGEMGQCQFSGDVKPLALSGPTITKGNVFDISLRFPADAACPVQDKAIGGILLPRSDNPDKSDFMIKYDLPLGGLMFFSDR